MKNNVAEKRQLFSSLVSKRLIRMVHECYLVDVFENINEELSKEIKIFWLKNKLLPSNVDWDQRARETCVLLLNENLEITGITSCFIVQLKDIIPEEDVVYGKPEDLYYDYRLHIVSQQNSSINLPVMTIETYNTIRKHDKAGIKGFITTLDNEKIGRGGIIKLFKQYDFEILEEKSHFNKVVVGKKFSSGKIKFPKAKSFFKKKASK